MLNAMKNLPQKTITIIALALISVLCLVSYFNYSHKQEMYEKFSSRLPDGFFNQDDPTFWRVAIKVSEQKIKDIETSGYKQLEQKKMERMGINITVTDELISEEYKQTKKELNFARKELKRLTEK
ncbi:hypothetical protein [Thiovibrio frasassiensis]|uniref:Uncharacterized protein n=1 Tax=Thiovibrio frasassiensis TaxID=2984131 RepID=A0A9X4RMI2_9BACT|nr:hypothetical protein [Thiovibrio frasassiensis]MDG4476799.1 hypothetical protein [Thiovibrio frasassiensis]